ncbi:MAG: peptide ABC transporter substrate-binding protein [Candidatus Eremiobacteraeota bacterium]|nr:peptide ABC transporter substrate-binding protein [Candidatus Eremiobacteraeota bacterium]MBC5803422.1 peptide ABC transporter substrate-binding protein [Candidatus Eremiobacteraeota bacterium]MBC5821978.1 peptide ABC transporter substrate-binding protein [Candidatus Eremiobacteraeota bacterium]
MNPAQRVRRLAAFAAALIVCAGCARVGGGSAGSGGRHPWTVPGHVRMGSPDEPDNLNPMFAHTAATDDVDAFIFAPLFRYDPKGNLVPELATEVPTYANGGISRDSKTIVLHFRHGVRWSDGVALTARDLRFTWRAVMNKRNNTKSTFGWDDITAIDVPRDDVAIVHLARPNADVMGSFGGGGGSAYPPLPEHLLGKLPDLNHAAFNAHPVSSGPWLLATWNHGASLVFAPNPFYWRGPPKLRGLEYDIVPNPDTLITELRTHEIDLIDGVPEEVVAQLEGTPGVRVVKSLLANWRHLGINCGKPPLDDVRVRRAVAEAVDWDRINRTVYHGLNLRAHTDIPPDSWAAPIVPLYPHDPAAARALLDAAGWNTAGAEIRRKRGTPLELTVEATNKPGNADAEVQMQQDLRAVGIKLTVKNYPASLLFAQDGPLYTGRYDIEWSIDTAGPDPDNEALWSGDFIPPHGANTSFLRDPIITRASAQAVRTFDRSQRKVLYQIEETRIHQLVPAVFVYWETGVAAYNDDLRGYRPAEYITNNWNSWEWSI